jgi:hypothetical protein
MCQGFGGYGTVEKAPPERLEGTFSELQPMRVPGQTRPTIAQRGASDEVEAVRRAICGLVCLSAPLIDGSRFTLAPST